MRVEPGNIRRTETENGMSLDVVCRNEERYE